MRDDDLVLAGLMSRPAKCKVDNDRVHAFTVQNGRPRRRSLIATMTRTATRSAAIPKTCGAVTAIIAARRSSGRHAKISMAMPHRRMTIPIGGGS